MSQQPQHGYEIVEFLHTKEVAVVPSGWMLSGENGETMCYWPPFKNSSRLNSVVQRSMPPESDWPTFLCRSMAHAGKNQHAMTYL